MSPRGGARRTFHPARRPTDPARMAVRSADETFSYGDRIALFLEARQQRRTRRTALTLRRAEWLLQRSAASLHRSALAFSVRDADRPVLPPAAFVF